MLEINDDGFVEVKLNGIVKRLDLYRVNNKLITLSNASPDPEGQNNKIVELLVAEGFGEVSHRAAIAFANAIAGAVADLKKKETSAVSPTASAS